jgi:hypothetical protein
MRTGWPLDLAVCAAAWVVACSVFPACSGCDDDQKRVAASVAPAPPRKPVPAPDGLVAELTVANPERIWSELYTAAGGSSVGLPRTVGGSLVQLLGLPLRLAAEFDESLPLVAAALAREHQGKPRVSFAFALHVKHGPRVATLLSVGEDGRFEREPKGDLTLMRPRADAPAALRRAVLGVFDNYLVVGSDAAALEAMAPYLARTMGPREPPAEAMKATSTEQALTGPMLAQLLERIATGVAPSSVAALVDVDAVIGRLRSELDASRVVQLTLRTAEDRLRLDARFEPKGGAAARLPAGRVDPAVFASLPDDSMLALAWVEDPDERRMAAKGRAAQLSQLLQLGPKGLARVETALGDVAEGRGDHTLGGFRCSGVGVSGFARGTLRDGERLARGLEQLLKLRNHERVERLLKQQGLSLELSDTRLTNVDFDVRRVRLERREVADAGAAAPALDLVFGVRDERFYVSAGHESDDTLRGLARGFAAPLTKVPSYQQAVARLPTDAAMVVLADLPAVLACRQGKPGESDPLVSTVAAGRAADGAGWVRLELPAALLGFAAQLL